MKADTILKVNIIHNEWDKSTFKNVNNNHNHGLGSAAVLPSIKAKQTTAIKQQQQTNHWWQIKFYCT